MMVWVCTRLYMNNVLLNTGIPKCSFNVLTRPKSLILLFWVKPNIRIHSTGSLWSTQFKHYQVVIHLVELFDLYCIWYNIIKNDKWSKIARSWISGVMNIQEIVFVGIHVHQTFLFLLFITPRISFYYSNQSHISLSAFLSKVLMPSMMFYSICIELFASN